MADSRREFSEGLAEGDALLAFSRSSISMVLTDPRIEDNPIIYVNRAFERTTGYSSADVVGRNCRFLQGPETDPADIDALREAIGNGDEISIDLVNYRADGDRFLNRLTITPLHDTDGAVSHFLGIQKELRQIDHERRRPTADRSMLELQHRVKNHLSMLVSLVRMQANSVQDVSAYSTLGRRVESLQLLYEEVSRPEMGGRSRISLKAYLERIVSAVSHLDGREGIRVHSQIEQVFAGSEPALKLGLIVSETVTNSLQHAFPDRDEGRVDVTLAAADGGIRVEVADDGHGIPADASWPNPRSLGGRIVLGLVDGLDARLEVLPNDGGTRVRLDVPAEAMNSS